MPYIIAALVAAIVLLGVLLKGSWEDNAEQAMTISTLTTERDSARTERDTLDATVSDLRTKAKQTAAKLDKTLKTINEVKDEDNCLDRPVPAALDSGLRHDRPDR